VRLPALALVLAAAQVTLAPTPAPEMRLEAVVLGRTPAPGHGVLDLAFLSDSQVVALTAQEVILYRWTEQGLVQVASRPLPGRAEPVRWPGGLLNVVEEDRALWALASTREGAVLFTVQAGRLAEGERAPAMPWPRCRSGLRYRPGTNLLEGEVDGLGPGPFLTLDAVSAAAVAADGRLLLAGTAPPPAQRRQARRTRSWFSAARAAGRSGSATCPWAGPCAPWPRGRGTGARGWWRP
jgi:hypothetical protein